MLLGTFFLTVFPAVVSASYEYAHYTEPECPSLKQCFLEHGNGQRYYPSSSHYSVPSGHYYFVCDIDGSTGGSPILFAYEGVVHKEYKPPYRIKDWYLTCGQQSQVTVDFSSYDHGVCFSQTYSIAVEACTPCSYHCPSYSHPINAGKPCALTFADCECVQGYYKDNYSCVPMTVPVHVPRPPVPSPEVPIYVAPTGTEPTVPISYNPPAPVAPLPIDEQESEVTCVAVIDENDSSDRNVETKWAEFRSAYPSRPFCLLRAPSTLGLTLPQGFPSSSEIFVEVTRDAADVDPATRSDWFNLCNLAGSRARGLTNVVLFVDNSGSMTTGSVQNAHDDFQAAVIANGMQVVDAVYNNREDYIEPCLSTSLLNP